MVSIDELEKQGKVLDFSHTECDYIVKYILENAVGAYIPFDSTVIDDVLEEIEEYIDNVLILKVWAFDDYNYIILFQDLAAWYKFSFAKCFTSLFSEGMFAGEQFMVEETFDEGNKCYDRESAELRLLQKCKNMWL